MQVAVKDEDEDGKDLPKLPDGLMELSKVDLPSGEAQVGPLVVDPGVEGLDLPCSADDGGHLFDLPSGEALVGPRSLWTLSA